MLKKTILIPAFALFALPAFAGVAKNVTAQDALDGKVPIVVAVEGGGTNIDFSQTGEEVVKGTLDDPSRIMVDATPGIPIVRLFRANISTADIPAASMTQLSVITREPSTGLFRLYIFPVTASAKPATYTKIVVGGTTSLPTTPTGVASALIGAKVAEQNKTLVDPKLKGRIAHYSQLRSNGMSDRKAASKAKISIDLARRLEELGSSPSPIVRVPVAKIPVGNAAHVPLPTPPIVEVQNLKLPPVVLTTETSKKAEAKAVIKPSLALIQSKKFDGQLYSKALLRGLHAAKLRGEIGYQSYTYRKINSSILALKLGRSLDAAIATSGLSRQNFMKLLRDGGLKI